MKTKTPPFGIRLAALVTLLVVSFLSAFAADVPAPSTPKKRDPSQPPEGISTSDWSGIRAAHEAARHAVQREADGSLMAENPGQQWRIRFDGRGFMVTRSAGKPPWGLDLQGYGFTGAEHKVAERAVISHEKGRVHYDWDATLREWFINDRRGLEQGWTFHQRPQDGGTGGPLRVRLAVRGGLKCALRPDASEVRFTDETGTAALTYGGLKAWDADGQPLTVRFEAGDERSFLIALEEGSARYPVTIDPGAMEAMIHASNQDFGGAPYIWGIDTVGDEFGWSVAISGDTVVVGAPLEKSTATGVNGSNQDNNDAVAQRNMFLTHQNLAGAGAAYVFVRDGQNWTQQAYLKSDSIAQVLSGPGFRYDTVLFGYSVAISGNTIIVGAPEDTSTATGVDGDPNEHSSGGNANQGAAYVFVRDGTTWTKQAYLKADPAAYNSNFGQKVAIDGNTAIIMSFKLSGDPLSGLSYTSGRTAHVFVRSGETWTQDATFENPVGWGSENGRKVAISGDTVVISGGYEQIGPHPAAGAAYVYRWDGSTWEQEARLQPSGPVESGGFGETVDISGDSIVVGSPYRGNSGNQSYTTPVGSAFVFVRSGTTWTQEAELKPSTADRPLIFGFGVGISDDQVVVSGMQRSDADPFSTTEGTLFLFSRTGSTWQEGSMLANPSSIPGQIFDCAISHGRIVSGMYDLEKAATFEAYGGRVVRDVNRTGAPGPLMPFADVTLVSGEDVLAIAATDADGFFTFPEPSPDLHQPHDVWLEKIYFDTDGTEHTVTRMYDSARILGPTAVSLLLPVNLHKLLNTQFKKLETTSSLVAGYDTTAARALMEDWSSIEKRTASEHSERDQAMGRLLSASEGMGRAYDAVDPLAKDLCKMVVNTIITFLSAAEVLKEVNHAMNGAVSTAAASGGLEGLTDEMFDNLRLIIGTGVEAATALVEIGKDQFIESLKSDVPEPWLSALDVGAATVIGGFSEAVSDGSWSRSGLNSGGKGDLLEALADRLGEQVGGRLLASAYVLETQQHLNTAVTRATNQDGDGTVAQGYAASLNKVIEIEQNADAALLASETAANIAKGWGYVADIAQAAGNIPGLQEARALALFLQTLNLTMVAGATGNELGVLIRTTITDVPQVPLLAFFPSGVPSSPAPSLVAQSSVQTTERPLAVDKSATLKSDGGGATANALPTDYATALAGLRARIVAGDRSGSLPDLQALLAAHESIHADIQSALLQTKTQAKTASPPRPALNSALHGLQTAGASLYQTFTLMYFDVVGWIIPDVADPTMTQARLLAEIDAVLAAITAFNQAQAAAETEAAGLVTPAYLATTTHGVAGADSSGRIQPGAYTLTARVINTGSQTATGFTAELTAVDPAAPVAVLQITSAASQALADLAPGESVR